MEDPKLDADIAHVKELIGIWQNYYKLLTSAFDKDKEMPPDADDQFQRIKTVVAQRHDHFSKVIHKDHYVAQNILQMVKRTISIYDFVKMSEVANDKTMIEWHEANLLLFETLGALEYQKHKKDKISEADFKKNLAKVKRVEQSEAMKRKFAPVIAAIPVVISFALLLLFGSVVLGSFYRPLGNWTARNLPFVHGIYQSMNVETDMDEPKPEEGEGAQEGG